MSNKIFSKVFSSVYVKLHSKFKAQLTSVRRKKQYEKVHLLWEDTVVTSVQRKVTGKLIENSKVHIW